MSDYTTNIDGHEILTLTINDLDISTCDMDSQGYRLTNGNNRCLYHGLDEYGNHLIWMSTSGDPYMLPTMDNPERLRNWLIVMGDEPDAEQHRILTGIERVNEALHELRGRYHHNDAALDQLEEFELLMEWAGQEYLEKVTNV